MRSTPTHGTRKPGPMRDSTSDRGRNLSCPGSSFLIKGLKSLIESAHAIEKGRKAHLKRRNRASSAFRCSLMRSTELRWNDSLFKGGCPA